MSTLTAGGTDWVDNVLNSLRFQFEAAVGATYEIDWIAIGHVAPAVETEKRVTALSAQYTMKADVNGHVAGIGLAVVNQEDGPITSDVIVLADRFSVALPAAEWLPNQAYTIGQYVKPTDAHGATGYV